MKQNIASQLCPTRKVSKPLMNEGLGHFFIALRQVRNLSQSDPPQAENPAKQDSFLFYRKDLATLKRDFASLCREVRFFYFALI